MSVDRWNTVLVLGGIRSGKSAYAESLVADAPSVRYLATATRDARDREWTDRIAAHQRRRPDFWTTEEIGSDPARLAAVLAEAKPDDTLLIDDLGSWVSALLDPTNQPDDDPATVAALAAAVRACAARVVVVSPEVGLSLVAQTPLGRAFADAIGTANQALAAVCDRVALIVAGQAVWLKAGESEDRKPPARVADVVAARTTLIAAPDAQPVAPASVAVFSAAPAATPADSPDIVQSGMDLPLPDSDAGPDARDRLETLDFAGAGIGTLSGAVEFAAATQHTPVPRPWRAVRLVLVCGRHAGGASAGGDPDDSGHRLAQLEAGAGPLASLAGESGADVAVARTADAAAMEDGPVTDAETVRAALRHGWELAERAAEDGRDVLVLGACGTGTDAAAAAVMAATTAAEAAAILPRVLQAGGRFDDAAWMTRAAAIRDALHRVRDTSRAAHDVLVELGGPDLAMATGVLLGATARRIPVLLDGPVGIAAAILARDLAGQSRHWCLLPEAGIHRLVEQGADVLGLTPLLRLGLDLGEGANALAVLPLLRSMIGFTASLPTHPALAEPTAADPDAESSAGPEPADSGDESSAGPEPADSGDE